MQRAELMMFPARLAATSAPLWRRSPHRRWYYRAQATGCSGSMGRAGFVTASSRRAMPKSLQISAIARRVPRREHPRASSSTVRSGPCWPRSNKRPARRPFLPAGVSAAEPGCLTPPPCELAEERLRGLGSELYTECRKFRGTADQRLQTAASEPGIHLDRIGERLHCEQL